MLNLVSDVAVKKKDGQSEFAGDLGECMTLAYTWIINNLCNIDAQPVPKRHFQAELTSSL